MQNFVKLSAAVHDSSCWQCTKLKTILPCRRYREQMQIRLSGNWKRRSCLFTCISNVGNIGLQGAAKNSPLKFFTVFSANVWNFNLAFHSFIYYNFLHLTAE